MAHLILIRHSVTQQDPSSSSHAWTLTDAGRERCRTLADHLRRYNIIHMASSDEPKATVTASIVASQLNIQTPLITDAAFGETRRETVPYYDSIDDFQSAIRDAMFSPNRVLFGEESFTDARLRFTRGLHQLVAAHHDQTLAVVTHGTVMALALGYFCGSDPYPLWLKLGMPAYAVLTPNLDVLDLHYTVE